MPSRFDAVIFDMDGLMVDTERVYMECNKTIAASYGKTVPLAVFHQMMGRHPLESLRIFCRHLQIAEDPAAVLARREDLVEQQLRRQIITMPGLFELLDDLKNRYRLAIVTGSPQRFLDIILDSLAIRARFEVLQTSDGLTQGKPHPEIYHRALRRLGLPGSRCAVLEDSPNGIRAARAAETYVIAVPNEHTLDADLSPADIILPSLHQARLHLQAIDPRP